jgi:hypothetical protein
MTVQGSQGLNDVLGKALDNLVDCLSGIVTAIINASEQVAAGSNSLSVSSMALSKGRNRAGQQALRSYRLH